MAADSRLTLSVARTLPDGSAQLLSLTSSDSAKKLFLTSNNVGIATCGAADIGGVPVAGFVESFIVERLKGKFLDPAEVSAELTDYFVKVGVGSGTQFQVSGYISNNGVIEQALYLVVPATNAVTRRNKANEQGATWNGEVDVLQRLHNDVLLKQLDSQPAVPLPSFGIPFQFFTLQDAIDFAVHGIRSTIETLRFQQREKTVGGPIDVLVIQPDSSQWIAQKKIVTPDQ